MKGSVRGVRSAVGVVRESYSRVEQLKHDYDTGIAQGCSITLVSASALRAAALRCVGYWRVLALVLTFGSVGMQSAEMFAGVPKPCPPNIVHCRPVAQQRGACQSVAAHGHKTTNKKQISVDHTRNVCRNPSEPVCASPSCHLLQLRTCTNCCCCLHLNAPLQQQAWPSAPQSRPL